MLLPPDEALLAEVAPLVDSLNASIDSDRPPKGPDFRSQLLLWRMLAVSLAEHRRGNDGRARDLARRCIGANAAMAPQKATAFIILGLSLARQDDLSAASAEVEQGGKMIEAALPDGPDSIKNKDGLWFDWVIARILLREARSVVGR
jgi:hypothetical protein